MLGVSISLTIIILSVVAIVVTIGVSKNEHEKEISDKEQMEYCRKIYGKSLKKKNEDLQ